MRITHKFLAQRVAFAATKGWGKSKWIEFSETLLNAGFRIELYEAKKTVSKYLTVIRGQKRFKVRFSNHKPNKGKEIFKDCDFFVGVNNLTTTNTNDALWAVKEHFDETHV